MGDQERRRHPQKALTARAVQTARAGPRARRIADGGGLYLFVAPGGWLRLTADQGGADAQSLLGGMYDNGPLTQPRRLGFFRRGDLKSKTSGRFVILAAFITCPTHPSCHARLANLRARATQHGGTADTVEEPAASDPSARADHHN